MTDDGVVLASDVVEQAINPAKLRDYDGPTGVVQGTVSENGAPIENALAGITGYSGFVVREKQPEVVVTERDLFDPKVVLLTYGQALVVENDTPQKRHPMFREQPHDLLVEPESGVRLHPKLLGRYKLVDGSRSADVYVAATPLHATTDAHGEFRINRVPVGKVLVNASHDGRETRAEIEVKAGVVTKVTLTLH